jgi:hypothetical protein
MIEGGNYHNLSDFAGLPNDDPSLVYQNENDFKTHSFHAICNYGFRLNSNGHLRVKSAIMRPIEFFSSFVVIFKIINSNRIQLPGEL